MKAKSVPATSITRITIGYNTLTPVIVLFGWTEEDLLDTYQPQIEYYSDVFLEHLVNFAASFGDFRAKTLYS